MAWPAVGVVGGGEASAASQPATGGRSTRHDRRWFGRLEHEDQRLKKHYGRWMDIIRSLELESCILLTKLTKPSVPVNLVGPQVSLPLYWVPANRGSIHFLCVIRRHFLACEDIAGGSELAAAVAFFRKIQRPFRWVPDVRWRNHYFARNKEAFPCVRPSCQPLHVKSTLDACRSLTTLTRPRREHQGGGRRRGLGRERHGAREDSTVVSHAEGSTRVY